MKRFGSRIKFELDHPAASGGRHDQIKRIVCSLRAARVAGNEMFRLLRPRYDVDVPDDEIWSLIGWAEGKDFQSGSRSRHGSPCRHSPPRVQKPEPLKPVTAEEATINAENWLGGFRADAADLFHVSPWRPPDNWRDDPRMFFAAMYHAGERINVVFGHRDGKPIGKGRTLERDEWLTIAKQYQIPFSEAGAWVRLNPTDGGGIADNNITACRFALLENDKVPLELQLSLLAHLPLPINLLALSGGKSVHAWLRVDAKDADQYRSRLKSDIFQTLVRFGFDQANSNPSRLARLPGVNRHIGAQNGGEQKLIYVAPDAREFRAIL